MEIHGWGRYPTIDSEVSRPRDAAHCTDILRRANSLIPRGLGRSYGDSSLAKQVLDTRYLDHVLSFDEKSGALTCAAGVSLDTILRIFVPRGWFLPVTPGTRMVTIGGAIASDVHGKNHHVDGSFSDHVLAMELLLGNGELLSISPHSHPELFNATCGGMGLTGVILSATLRLKPVRASAIIETTIKTPDLDSVLCAFTENASATYSVAWIDCLARGKHLGRSLLMLGEHAEKGPLVVQEKKPLPIPIDMPSCLLNGFSVKAFNTVYYGKSLQTRRTRCIPFEPFFYPLDVLSNWNRLYGKPGFIQYQFVLPEAKGLREILERIASSGKASFLAVLKAFGKGNGRYLSFPSEGYTLALDFKAEPSVFQLLNELDKVVLEYGGRLNLCKDSRISVDTFRGGYPQWQEFQEIRGRYHAIGKFSSHQSLRLGLQ